MGQQAGPWIFCPASSRVRLVSFPRASFLGVALLEPVKLSTFRQRANSHSLTVSIICYHSGFQAQNWEQRAGSHWTALGRLGWGLSAPQGPPRPRLWRRGQQAAASLWLWPPPRDTPARGVPKGTRPLRLLEVTVLPQVHGAFSTISSGEARRAAQGQGDVPACPVVKNLPFQQGAAGLIPGRERDHCRGTTKPQVRGLHSGAVLPSQGSPRQHTMNK